MSTNPPSTPITVLLVEDDPGDVLMTREALADSKLLNELAVANDGEEAIEYLRAAADTGTPKKPDLILLDLNLPRKDGRELLAEIKQNPDLKRIPVVVLTTSEAEQDILKTYDLHANCYITKPVDLDKFVTIVKGLEEFWLSIVKLPSMVTAQAKPNGDR